MKKLKQIEFIILITLWIGSLLTYSIALANNYILHMSDYFGLIGLTVVSIISFSKPEKAVCSVLTLLTLGLFNILSFVYFFNWVMTFGFSILVTPGIQLISLFLLVILIILKKKEVIEIYRNIFGQTEEDKKLNKLNIKIRFMNKFKLLSDHEIDILLQNDLVPEAKEVLNEIKKDRINTQQ